MKKSVSASKKAPLAQTARFPKLSLQEALKIPQAIKEKNGGNPWSTEEVAKAVELSKKSNNFFYLAAASRDYGLTNGSRDSTVISLTDLGRTIVYAPNPEEERQRKIEAFLKVDVFGRVLDFYKSSDLPEMKYLSNTLENQFGLPPSVHADFSRLFRENCDFLKISKGFTTKTGESNGKRPTPDTNSTEPPATVTLAEPLSGTGKVAFVIMPFTERENGHPEGFFQEVQRSLLTPAARDAGFKVKTANRQGSDLIQSTIINDLLDADLVIADLTEHNPNVLFELGVRIAGDLPTVLVKATGTGRIFDVDNVIRVYEYNPNLWRTSVEEDLPKLIDFIKGAWESKESDRTYMKILRRQA
jgi:hypothetical protein